MSLLYDAKQEGYLKTRRVSAGAGITLVCKTGEYVAQFQCAKRVAEVLGDRGLIEKGDGLFESIPAYAIPIEEMPSACEKLSQKFSIALVDITCEKESRFALVYKIARKVEEPEQPTVHPLNLDEF
jgi:hypothetical protein